MRLLILEMKRTSSRVMFSLANDSRMVLGEDPVLILLT